MQHLSSKQVPALRQYFIAASTEASFATCTRARCGSVIVSQDGEIIGKGHNAPVLDDEAQRTCMRRWNYLRKPKYDLTCCVHAEWNAVITACKNQPDKISGSTLYFMRIDRSGAFTNAGVPYCTTCSRFVMQAGIAKFALWNDDGADIYDMSEYNQLSYNFYKLS